MKQKCFHHILGHIWRIYDISIVHDDDGDCDSDDVDGKTLIIPSRITILCVDNNRLTYETKKPRNDEDLARRLGPTDGPTDGQTNRLIEMRGRI